MKRSRLFLVFLMLIGFGVSISAQRNCATMDNLEQLQQQDPETKNRMEQIERHTQRVLQSGARSVDGVITIPIVFHIVYNTPEQNISDAQVQSQLDILNEDFRRINADAGNTPDDFRPVVADVQIQFCLASTDPEGNFTTGITRTQTDLIEHGTNNTVKFNDQGGKDAWPSGDYLNLWVCNLSGTLLGYAQFPDTGTPETDGVVCDYLYVGNIGTATAPYDLGRTATHEVGHWLNLRHIWGDGGCGIDDEVSDTPLAGGSNGTQDPCTYPGPNSCVEENGDLPDMFQNYMDYSGDACMNLFTKGQKARMRALFEEGGFRLSLLNSNGCSQAPPPTCDDGLQNGNETGVDCGGPDCAECPPTCFDGIQNGDETEIDCGGSSCLPCPSCDDGIQNGQETDVDCGGPDCIACPTCSDGIQNGEETSVDCGGPECLICPTCTDGIQNGLETGIDCGGPDCASCNGCLEQLNFNNFNTDLGIWIDGGSDCRRSEADVQYSESGVGAPVRLRDNSSSSVLTTSNMNLAGYTRVAIKFSYITVSMDTPSEDFWLQLSTDGGNTFTTIEEWNLGDEFENDIRYFESLEITWPFTATTQFRFRCDAGNDSDYVYLDNIGIMGCDGDPVEPTCTDGIQNGQETGVDCGGPDCPSCPTEPTCTDGIQNGQETGVDCGGPDCPSCPTEPTCDDGIQNGQETGVDCGGPDCPSCPTEPTCDDGIQNGQETGVDCGGPDCPACPVEPTCSDGIQNGNETGIDCGGPDCVPCSTECTVQEVDFNDFNTGWGIWNDGGSDCTRSSSDAQYSVGGVGAPVRLRDNSSSSHMTTDNLALLTYQELTVNFSYITVSMDNANEDFFLEVSTDGGSTFTVVEEWNLGDEFENDVRYFDAVTIAGPFSNSTQLRFRCDASTNSDLVYIDDVRITGCNSGGSEPTCTDGIQNGQETGVDCGGPDCPTCPTEPTCTDGIQNGQETGVDCGGPDCPSCPTEPTCTDGIQNGQETGVDCGGPDCPTCPTEPTCDDGIQNGQEQGVDCGGPDCAPCSGECTTQLIDFNDFNTSFGIWNDGGSDCTRSSAYAQYAVGGTGSAVRLRDNSSSSNMTTDNLNLSAYQDLTVDFSYITVSMDNPDEDFFLEISTDGGNTFTIVEEWNLGDEFENEVRYFDAVSIPGPFSANTQLRFRCDASTNSDQVYLDDISISGCSFGAALASPVDIKAPKEALESVGTQQLALFPNPVRSELLVSFDLTVENDVTIAVTNLQGKVMGQQLLDGARGKNRTQLDVSRYPAGIYVLKLSTKTGSITEKFVVVK